MTTEQRIYNTAIKDGMPPRLSELIVDQSKHETGNYEHRFFTIGNNAFGYSYNKNSKWQLDKGGPLADNGIPIAQYASVENSVHEMTDWIKRRQSEGKFPENLASIKTPDEYASYLKASGYYQASLQDYAAGIARYFNAAVKNFTAYASRNKGLVIGGLALIAAAAVVIIKRKQIFG